MRPQRGKRSARRARAPFQLRIRFRDLVRPSRRIGQVLEDQFAGGHAFGFPSADLVVVADHVSEDGQAPDEHVFGSLLLACLPQDDLQGLLDHVLQVVLLHPSFGDAQESYTEIFEEKGLGAGIAGQPAGRQFVQGGFGDVGMVHRMVIPVKVRVDSDRQGMLGSGLPMFRSITACLGGAIP